MAMVDVVYWVPTGGLWLSQTAWSKGQGPPGAMLHLSHGSAGKLLQWL